MADQLRNVDAETVLQQLPTLGDQIDGTATVRVDEDRRDPLREQRPRVAELGRGEAAGGVRMRVDEAGDDPEPAGVDNPTRARPVDQPNGNDPVTGDGHVGAIPRVAGAVDDESAGDDEVVGLLGQRCRCRHSEQQGARQEQADSHDVAKGGQPGRTA